MRLEVSVLAVFGQVGPAVPRADVGQRHFSGRPGSWLLWQHHGEDCSKDDGLCGEVDLGDEMEHGLNGDLNHGKTP